jgi:predicted alpha/beta superfamily hydrolase
MKILFVAVWISFLIQCIIIPQSKIEIQVISTLSSNQKVFIVGNKQELGNWNPDKVSLNKINDSTWSEVFKFNTGDIIEFKLTIGSWDQEALDESGKVPENFVYKVTADTILRFKIDHWGKVHLNITGQITGEVRYHKQFEGRSVLPRDIIVWLPPGYDSLSDKYYPVLYMHDGQNVFDPLTSSFGVDWQIDEVADSLIRARSIQEIIIVGIYNTEDRGSEYNDTELGHTYINFIINELKPFIDMTYKTLPDSKNTAVCGSSSGGLISFIMAWEYPDVFSKSACFSPAFKISNINYVAPVENYMGAKRNLKVFIYNGGIGLEERLQPGIDEMILVLKEKGFIENQDLLFIKDSFAEHNESAWAKNVYRFLEFFFPLEN